MNTDNNQNKQLTELSDEELKQVTGGKSEIFNDACLVVFLPPCQQGYVERNHCCVPA